MPGRALKVFQAHLGFFDTVVAVPSKKAALEAWGSSQDLFHTGLASAAEEKDAIRAALAHPGVVLKRPAGSRDPFTAEPGLAKVKSQPKKPAVPKTSPQREPKPAPEPPDRGELDAAEKALARLKDEMKSSAEELARKKKELASKEREAKNKFHARERELEQRLAKAKRDFARAARKGK
jgi:colicin import membrane protein